MCPTFRASPSCDLGEFCEFDIMELCYGNRFMRLFVTLTASLYKALLIDLCYFYASDRHSPP